MTTWRNRIIGHGDAAPDQILANPRNARIHPQSQQAALLAVLDGVGVVQDVIVNRATGFLIDGHARVMLALRTGQPSIPVKYVDLSPDEESLIIATLDAIGAQARYDRDILAVELPELAALPIAADPALGALLDTLAASAGIPGLAGLQPPDGTPEYPDPAQDTGGRWRVTVFCDNEMDAADLAAELRDRGLRCHTQ